MSIQLFTSAPAAYDYGTATEVDTFTWHGHNWRVVIIDEPGADEDRVEYLAQYQEGRYRSGWYGVLREDPRKAP